jgi:hypothetical protein
MTEKFNNCDVIFYRELAKKQTLKRDIISGAICLGLVVAIDLICKFIF